MSKQRKQVDTVLVFPNMQLAVLSDGKQVPELQINLVELIGERAAQLGLELENAELRTGVYMGKITKEPDGKYGWTV